MVLSFVRNHNARRSSSADVQDAIIGKAQSLFVLLSGPPGTGKTMMAEAVADRARRPLLCLRAEDLGNDPDVLGTRLKYFCEIATSWNAIILLDEADAFLSQRDPTDIFRYVMVSTLLRELECFSGTVFFTTNLRQDIDVGFHSRVSMHILFQPLGQQERGRVWRNILGRLAQQPRGANKATTGTGGDERPQDLELDDKTFAQLAAWEINGREIETTVKSVYSWCRGMNAAMTLERLEAGIRAANPDAKKTDPVEIELYD